VAQAEGGGLLNVDQLFGHLCFLEIDILHRRVRAGDTELHLTSIEQTSIYCRAGAKRSTRNAPKK
jgi:hypothetical protein